MFVLHDMVDQPDFNWETQNNRGDWSTRDVTTGGVYAGTDGKPECVDHKAMNAVVADRSIWRCLMCGRATWVTWSNMRGDMTREELGPGNRVVVYSWYHDKRFAGRSVRIVKNVGTGLIDIVNDDGEKWTLHKENVVRLTTSGTSE